MSALCRDCGMDTTPRTGKGGRFRDEDRWEYYMVWDAIWVAAGMDDEVEGYLCIGCLEERLGRALEPEDFPDYPINWPDRFDTERLANRKGGDA